MKARRAPRPLAGVINTKTIAEGYLEREVASCIQSLTESYLHQLHLGHMDADDFEFMSLTVDFQRDRHSGNGASLIVTVGEE